MAEDIGISGRAGYYDGIGAARDVIQNHLLQLMALTAMEEPTAFDAKSLRIEKQKVLESVVLPRRLDLATARGQYTEGWSGGVKVPGYLDEDWVAQAGVALTIGPEANVGYTRTRLANVIPAANPPGPKRIPRRKWGQGPPPELVPPCPPAPSTPYPVGRGNSGLR